MSLGRYKFHVGKNAFDTIRKKSSYRWAEIEKIRNKSSLQFTGINSPTISIDCTLYAKTNKKSPALLVSEIEHEAAKGVPLGLVDLNGNYYGRWVITSISSDLSLFNKWSIPEKSTLNIELKGYDRW